MRRGSYSFISALAAGLLGSFTLLTGAGAAMAQNGPPKLTISHMTSLGLSPRLSDLPSGHVPELPHEIPLHHPPAAGPGPQQPSAGGSVQTSPGPALATSSGLTFQGLTYNGSWPPDPNIAVGKTTTDTSGNCVGGYVVQVVNTEVAVFDKCTGNMLHTSSGHPYPVDLSYLWAGTGCQTNSGDPIVQYDRAADRWLITQIGSLSSTPFSECLALSQTGDPTGAYSLWQDSHFGSSFDDYPKFGVWPTATNSAYLATYNLFLLGISFQGAQLCAYDRDEMLADAPTIDVICGTVSDPSFLPADLDGDTPPADGTPAYFLDFNSTSSLRLYALTPDFTTPSNSTLTFTNISVPSFKEACNGGTCIPQPGTSQQLDSLGDRLMYRLAFRMLGGNGTPGSGTPTMVVNHSVAVGGRRNGNVGIRWYELQPSNGIFGVAQSGTYAPDSAYRWMGSMAMDKDGNIALGYSKSSGSLYPEVDFTGHTPGMTSGTMGLEVQLQPGSGSEMGCPSGLSCSRWGDYTAMRSDPDDNGTFWYTNEYYTGNSYTDWATVIGSFKIASGSSPSTYTLTVNVTGGGTVTSSPSGISCPSTCSASFDSGTTVSLTAAPAGGWTFAGWSGACSGTASCSVTMDGPQDVSATFTQAQSGVDFSLSVSPSKLVVKRGSTKSATVTVTSTSGTDLVGLSVAGMPSSGVTYTLSPSVDATTTGTSDALTVTVDSLLASKGDSTITITGDDGTNTHVATMILSIK